MYFSDKHFFKQLHTVQQQMITCGEYSCKNESLFFGGVALCYADFNLLHMLLNAQEAKPECLNCPTESGSRAIAGGDEFVVICEWMDRM